MYVRISDIGEWLGLSVGSFVVGWSVLLGPDDGREVGQSETEGLFEVRLVGRLEG